MFTISQSVAQGHGPVFGLQTPTLAKGGVNFNVAGMSMATKEETSYMLRYILFYGITEDIQVTVTTPTSIRRMESPPGTRGGVICLPPEILRHPCGTGFFPMLLEWEKDLNLPPF